MLLRPGGVVPTVSTPAYPPACPSTFWQLLYDYADSLPSLSCLKYSLATAFPRRWVSAAGREWGATLWASGATGDLALLVLMRRGCVPRVLCPW